MGRVRRFLYRLTGRPADPPVMSGQECPSDCQFGCCGPLVVSQEPSYARSTLWGDVASGPLGGQEGTCVTACGLPVRQPGKSLSELKNGPQTAASCCGGGQC